MNDKLNTANAPAPLGCEHEPPCPGTQASRPVELQSFVIVETDRGAEVWRDEAEDKLVAVFTERGDADFFVYAAGQLPVDLRAKIREYWRCKQQESRRRKRRMTNY